MPTSSRFLNKAARWSESDRSPTTRLFTDFQTNPLPSNLITFISSKNPCFCYSSWIHFLSSTTSWSFQLLDSAGNVAESWESGKNTVSYVSSMHVDMKINCWRFFFGFDIACKNWFIEQLWIFHSRGSGSNQVDLRLKLALWFRGNLCLTYSSLSNSGDKA